MQKERFEILLEDIRSDVKGLADGISDLRNNDERIMVCVQKVEGELKSQINFVYTKLDYKIDVVDQKLSKRIDEVDEKLSNRIDGVDQNLSKGIIDSEKRLSGKIDRTMDMIENHEIRLVKLEK